MIDRILDVVDEWAHRRGLGKVIGKGGRSVYPWYWRLTPFPFLCDWRDTRLLGVSFRELREPRNTADCPACNYYRKNGRAWREGDPV